MHANHTVIIQVWSACKGKWAWCFDLSRIFFRGLMTSFKLKSSLLRDVRHYMLLFRSYYTHIDVLSTAIVAANPSDIPYVCGCYYKLKLKRSQHLEVFYSHLAYCFHPSSFVLDLHEKYFCPMLAGSAVYVSRLSSLRFLNLTLA